MSFEFGKPQWRTIARTEVKYLDMQGNPVEPQQAAKVITIEYDEKEDVICACLSVNFRKVKSRE